jgi:arylsulfatase A-like enzyme
MVSRLDADVGRLVARIDELGLGERTLVLFTADNGPEYEKTDGLFNSNGPLRGGKRDLYEGGIRVPTVARWTGTVAADARQSKPFAFWDVLPTLAELAGVTPTDPAIDGVSFAPTLVGTPERQRERGPLYWEINESQGPIQALRRGDWKLVYRHSRKPELYDLARDPAETTDLSPTHPELVKGMLDDLAAERTEHPAFPLRRINGK